MGMLSKLKERERTKVYCENVLRNVSITKWYNNYGDRRDIGNPDVYTLICEEPWKEAEERVGRTGRKKVNIACGNDRKCPYLLAVWNKENGKGSAIEVETAKIKPDLDPTTFLIEYLVCRHKGRVAILGQDAIERITKFSPGICVGNSLIKMGLAEEVGAKKRRSYRIDLEALRKYYYEHGSMET